MTHVDLIEKLLKYVAAVDNIFVSSGSETASRSFYPSASTD